MPKSPSVLLKLELSKHGYEVLDIYEFRDKDVIRVKVKSTGKVFLYESKKHVKELNRVDELKALVSDIVSYVKQKKLV